MSAKPISFGWRQFFDQSVHFMAVLDLDGAIVAINKAALDLTGAREDDLAGRAFWDAPFWPDRVEAEGVCRAAFAAVLAGRAHRQDTAHVTAQGLEITVDFAVVPFHDEFGVLCGFLVEGRDVSDARLIRAQLAESEARFRAIFEHAPYSITLARLDGTYVDVNNAFLKRNSVTRETALGLAAGDTTLLGPDEIRAVRERLAAEGCLHDQEAPVRLPDGGSGHVLYSAVLVPMAGQNYVLSMAVDITARKQAEEAALRWQRKFDLTTAAARLVFYEYDLKRDYITWSGSVRDVLGYASFELEGGLHVWSACVHPDDAARVMAVLEAAQRRAAPYIIEYRMRRKDGSYADVFEHGQFFGPDSASPDTMLGIIQDVSGLKRMESDLARSERKFRDIFNNAPLGIFRTAFTGHFVEANPTLARMLGYDTREELLAKVQNLERDIYFRPEVRRELLAELKASPQGISREIEFKRQDGTPFHAVINASLQFDAHGDPAYMDGTIEDITLRKRAEDELRQSEEKFANLFRLSPDAIALFRHADRRIVDVNEAFLRLFGFERAEVLGRTSLELGLYKDANVRARLHDLADRQETLRDFEVALRAKDGSEVLCALAFQVFRLGGESYVFIVLRDLREAKRMQQVMIQTEKMQSLGGLAAGMAHEINNPLGIIVQSAQNILRRLEPDLAANIEVAERHGVGLEGLQGYLAERNIFRYLDAIREAGQRAADIIADMLSFSRRSERAFSCNDVGAIAARALELAGKDYDLKKHYDFRRITQVRELCPDLPCVPCVASEIEQVLLNLFRNAAQAMAGGGVSNPTLTTRTRLAGDHVLIEVEDNGPGIPPAILSRIFEPFFTTKPVGEGTGLGLSVSYFIVTHNHGGQLTVSSREGRGTKFVISLPLRQGE